MQMGYHQKAHTLGAPQVPLWLMTFTKSEQSDSAGNI